MIKADRETKKPPRRLQLMDPITDLLGVGEALAKKLMKLGINRAFDLLHHYPARYLDFSKIQKIDQLRVGEEVTVIGRIKEINKSSPRLNLKILKVGIFDETGYIFAIWFNQDYIAKRLKKEDTIAISGKVASKFGVLQIQNPYYDIIEDDFLSHNPINTAAIIPVHSASMEISPARIRRLVSNLLNALGKIDDYLPSKLRKRFALCGLDFAIKEIHFPSSAESIEKARARLLFDELFLLQLGLIFRKNRLQAASKGIVHKIDEDLLHDFFENLPFTLTGDQLKAIEEIKADMARPTAMNRLLQGEVGSGKTMVALATLMVAVKNGYQGAMMAPTEVLAKQHHKNLSTILSGLGIKSDCLTGSLSSNEKTALKEEISSGVTDIVFGTHALIQEDVSFAALGAIVVDEQHRFGVEQRLALKGKGSHPDVLIMTATPIPRSLSLTLYGDLDVSSIRERPKGRAVSSCVETYVVSERQRERAYKKIIEEIKKGSQAYIICPLIEESDKLALKSVKDEVEKLKKDIFSAYRVGVIHGRLKPQEKDGVMEEFKKGQIDILISTTVIEVGIDVPNATVILIEDADRFGLSQLHQLRGRIGRGKEKSFCILFAKLDTDESRARMKAIKELTDGFTLAEQDLIIRGQGEIFGTRQSGLPDLKLASLPKDYELLKMVRSEAARLIKEDPALTESENERILEAMKLRFFDKLAWLFIS
ncbi:MAG: ATP-dependent DNA helicase RecG [Actinomycetota bacterium]|nr:ATP-dependent DNA helicase RecG [Actinomycetota bacterium]